uniref:acyltransferase n=1 Tax=Scandinavium goeteborgense TaxID=1851514 RepID=UPI00135AAD08|nr:acyltransferase [Scandinavium goeteborgense]
MAILTYDEINALGFASVGKNVLISSKASFYGASRINIGNNVRIDDFCVLSAGEEGIDIDDYVHIAVFSSLIGYAKIEIGKYCNISSRVSIYSSSDDFSGEFMTNPMVDEQFTNVIKQAVRLSEHVVVGCGSVILPGVKLGKGCAVGSLTLVKNSFKEYTIIAGTPAKKISNRSRQLEKIQQDFESF